MSIKTRNIPWAVPMLATLAVVAALIAVAAFPGTGQAAPTGVTAAVPDPDPGQALLVTWTSVAADTGAIIPLATRCRLPQIGLILLTRHVTMRQ